MSTPIDFTQRLVAPSVLASNFAELGAEVQRVDAAGADWIHCDVMDGHFVDNISFGPAFVDAVARSTARPLDTHLMVTRPDHYFPRFTKTSRSITVHVEADHDIAQTLLGIRAAGCAAGLALNPATAIDAVLPYLGQIDLLLVMTVVPGFGGQPFMPETMEKVKRTADWRREHAARFHIEVDGGIDTRTAPIALAAGANVLVAGTSVFRAPDLALAIRQLRGA